MRTGERGFGYVFLLILVAIIAFASSQTIVLGAAANQRQAEQELMDIGQAFERALHSYAGQPLAGVALPPAHVMPPRGLGPMRLEDLLRDPRTPGVRRHLRKIHADPMTGRAEWGLIRDETGRIVGMHSLSERSPLKQSGFDAAHAHFEEARSYREWVFGLPTAATLHSRRER